MLCHGIPQGSIVGPLLFLVFINDLCNLKIQNTYISSYADDTAFLLYADSWPELQVHAQTSFNVVLNWLQTNSLTLNASKTKFIPFSASSVNQPDSSFSLYAHKCSNLNGCDCPQIFSTETIKYLGVTLDKHLKFNTHINNLCSRVRKLIYVFKTLRKIANPQIIKNTYLALCQSILTYCITCWGGAAKTIIKPLEIAQRAILKVATNRPILFPTHKLYELCKVLSVRQLFIFNTLTLQHRLTPLHAIPSNKRRKDKICTIPSSNLAFTQRHNYYLGPYLYNKFNKIKYFHNLSLHECKNIITELLSKLTYDETENFMIAVT